MAEGDPEDYGVYRRIQAELNTAKQEQQRSLKAQGIAGFKAASRQDERRNRERMAKLDTRKRE